MKTGQIVKLHPDYAKWHLDHPDIYIRPDGSGYMEYEAQHMLHILCCMGEPIYGTIEQADDGIYFGVNFECDGLETFYFVEKKHVILPEIYRLL